MSRKKASARLKEARARRKLSQASFGYLVGASASRVSEWESGQHKPDRDHGIALARLTRSWGDEIRVEDW